MTEKLYTDADGNTCTLSALCRKDPEWAASIIRTLEARWDKYTEPGTEHPKQAPDRIWVQWMPRLRGAVVYNRSPAILDGTIGAYVLADLSYCAACGADYCAVCGKTNCDGCP
jgi:hypothetical protein